MAGTSQCCRRHAGGDSNNGAAVNSLLQGSQTADNLPQFPASSYLHISPAISKALFRYFFKLPSSPGLHACLHHKPQRQAGCCEGGRPGLIWLGTHQMPDVDSPGNSGQTVAWSASVGRGSSNSTSLHFTSSLKTIDVGKQSGTDAVPSPCSDAHWQVCSSHSEGIAMITLISQNNPIANPWCLLLLTPGQELPWLRHNTVIQLVLTNGLLPASD